MDYVLAARDQTRLGPSGTRTVAPLHIRADLRSPGRRERDFAHFTPASPDVRRSLTGTLLEHFHIHLLLLVNVSPNENSKSHTLDEMSRLFQNSSVIGNNNQNIGNIVKSYNNTFQECTIITSEDKGQVLEWLSPWTSRERHGTVRNERADGVGDWLLREAKFSTWHTLEDGKPVLLCYGDPGVGKTYMRYEPQWPPE
ncbi:hypothetical protein HOY82DRAFT_538589 [Tuber indicum]|nr:hypothetical protein HOY82DRAFT_538589 [Tuber indicum]